MKHSLDHLTKSFLRTSRQKVTEIHKQYRGGRITIGLFAFGGHGDLLRLMTFAAAVRKLFPRDKAHLTLICKYIAPTYSDPDEPTAGRDGWAVNDEIIQMIGLQEAFAVDHVLQMHLVRWEHAVNALRPKFDLFWEVQYTAQLSVRSSVKGYGQLKHRADKALRPWRPIFDGFPESNPQLNDIGMSQFETLASSSGLDVLESDMRIEVEPLADGVFRLGGRAWKPIVTFPPQPYVVWHNGAGGHATCKCLPMHLAEEGVTQCRSMGVAAVQVGRRDKEEAIPGALDYRGCSILDTMLLLRYAAGHFDVEGGIRYLAHCVGRSTATFYGPTPDGLFGWTDAMAVTSRRCEPCWWSCRSWDEKCVKGHPWCLNMPQSREEMREVVRGAMEYFKLPAAGSSSLLNHPQATGEVAAGSISEEKR